MMRKSLVFILFMAVVPVELVAIIVNNTDDSGSGSLRQAIIDANANPGQDTITMATPGTLSLLSPLPPITQPVIIDGTGQNFIIDGNNNAAVGLEIQTTASNSEIFNLSFQNIGISTIGQSAHGIIVDADGVVLDGITITNVFGFAGLDAIGQNGGIAIGVELNGNAGTVLNSSISQVTGGNGGTGSAGAPSFGGPGGAGGKAVSISINGINNTIDQNNMLALNTGGTGGDGGTGISLSGAGGSGGAAISIEINSSGNTVTNNSNLANNVGGNGGDGGSLFVEGGSAGLAVSIAINGASNIISNNDMLQLNTGGNAGAGFGTGTLTAPSGGLGASFFVTGSDNTIEQNTNLGLNTGGTGGTGPAGPVEGFPGGTGGAGASVFISGSGNDNTIFQNSSVLSNTGGDGGQGGQGGFDQTFPAGDGGSGGNGVHMFIIGSGNDIRENLLNAIHTAGSGGPGGIGDPDGQPGDDGATFGILVDTGNEDSILTNSIFGSASQPGIQLINEGNDEQVEPTITSFASCGDLVSVTGELNNNDASLGNRQYIIEFFSNGTSSDPEQGQIFIGQITVTTDANGNVSFAEEFSPVAAFADNDFITATATLNSGTPINNTSEFSVPIQASIGQPVDNVSVESQDGDPVTITLSGMSSTPMMFEIIQQPTNGTLSTITPLTGPPNITAEVIYTPNANFAGFDSFVYSFEDDDCIGIVTIKVLSGDPNRDLTPLIADKYGPFCNLLLN